LPRPVGGAYSVPPDPLAGFRGPTSKAERRGNRERVGCEGVEGKGIEGGRATFYM